MIINCLSCRAQMKRCTRRNRCRACERDHYCMNCSNCVTSLCTKVRSARPTRSGLHWWHLADAPCFIADKPRAGTTPVPANPLASIEHRHDLYVTLLREHLVLSAEHRAKLTARGFSELAAERNGYRSTPSSAFAERIAHTLDWHGLNGVPGFYRKGDRWQMVNCRPGILIPVKDERGRIQAFQVRRDEGEPRYLWLSSAGRPYGTSSGAPLHHAYHHLLADCDEVVVTEGALKADVIAYFTQQPVVGVAGVSNFGRDFATHLRTVAPALRTVVVAYDSDLFVKREVLRALESLTTQLQRAHFRVRVRTWPPQWKGFDDYLLAQLQRTEVCAA